jgi:hypothetical protein
MKTRNFKSGDRVVCNGNPEAVVIGYPYHDSNVVEVRLWQGGRLVGHVVADQADLKLIERKVLIEKNGGKS